MRKWLTIVASGLIGVAAIVLVLHGARPQLRIGGPSDRPRLPLDQVDHAAFDQLTQKYVDAEGLVAYTQWQATPEDIQALDDYLTRLGAVDLAASASPAARLAFWINAYNALTIKGILALYPTASIRNHTPLVGGYNIWRDLRLWVDGQEYSLDDIEHRILRKLDEPRIHFALVCAAKGCPPLRQRAWTADTLDANLADSARHFFARPSNFQAEPPFRTVSWSELLKWYGSDFAPTPLEQVRRLRAYFPQGDRLSWLDEPDVIVTYLEYDWSLNDQRPPAR